MGDPMKNQMDFYSDMNEISMKAPSIKQKLRNIIKSLSLGMQKIKPKFELKEEN